ncbi:uncharacterized protein LOC125477835 isoform X2 [Pyrus x bretschneideri]|uniref:uncharacterized protein LOC125477835 isoform X2 n=1 Tax=Pyrus x bretschneideri TaxID=225117 RepID=UPI00202EDFE0|nr:uncharacterized protein LOC125477835 isoform X2 [Pyrus x bretschneideri]
MSGKSRGRVTITLGRGGQVVKRSVSGSSLTDSIPVAGTKRSVRDRLGSNVDGSLSHGSLHNNKRQRGDNDAHIGRGDLRFKLMQKNAFRRAQSDDGQRHGDLREKLSKAVQRPVTVHDSRQHLPEIKETSFIGRIPSSRADDLPHVDSLRNSYSPWTLDHLRRRSPDRVVVTSRGLSSPRNPKELERRPLSRAFDDVRLDPYMRKDVPGSTRPASSVPFMSSSPLPHVSAKPVAPPPPHLSQIPPLSSIVQKSSYAGDEQQTVDGLLHTLGLGKYAIIFKAEEIDMTALKQMGENDLKELGIPMGPRKKLLLALLPRSKRPPATNVH